MDIKLLEIKTVWDENYTGQSQLKIIEKKLVSQRA